MHHQQSDSVMKEMTKGRFMRAFLCKLRKVGALGRYCWWAPCCFEAESSSSSSSCSTDHRRIPRDVPKGHLVVYVGEEQRRFVIRVAFLDHPLFKALLDRAREEYNFCSRDSRLCIPCDESIFLNVLRSVNYRQRPGRINWLPLA